MSELTPELEEQVRRSAAWAPNAPVVSVLAELDATRAERDRLRADLLAAVAVLRSVEWEGDGTDAYGDPSPSCPSCASRQSCGHRDGCALAAAIQAEQQG